MRQPLLTLLLLPSLAIATPYLNVNGSRQPTTTIGETQRLQLYAGFDAAEAPPPATAEWWAVADTPIGWYSYRPGAGWQAGIHHTHQGAEPYLQLLDISGLPAGLYTFYFGYDLTLDGALDAPSLRYTSVEVTIGTPSPVATCGDRGELFNRAPLDAGHYHSIVGLGATNPSGHTFPTVHTYLMLADNRVPAPVYAPGDVTVTAVTRMENLHADSTDYVLRFTPCTEVYGYYDHVSELSEELLAAVEPFDDCWTYADGSFRLCNAEVEIPLAAGSRVGWAGAPDSASAALDFGLRDERVEPLHYANEDRLANSDQRFVVCPYDYYEGGAVKETLFAKLRAFRSDEPVCGEVAYDLEGSARGLWFLEGSDDDGEHGNIALVPSVGAPDSVGVLSIGNPEVGIDAYYFDYATSGRINRPFDAVTADGHIWCWDTLRNREQRIADGNAQPLDGILYLTLESDTTLRLERDAGRDRCPNDPDDLVFTAAAVRFVR